MSDIESLESSKASDSASINALGREINYLEEENRKLNEKIDSLEADRKRLEDEITRLEKLKAEEYDLLQKKIELIESIKLHLNSEKLEEPIKAWIDALDKGEYEAAFKLYGRDNNNTQSYLSLGEFSDKFKSAVKSIKIKSLKLYTEGEKGNVAFVASLDIKYADNADKDKAYFAEGLTDVLFEMEYTNEKDGWIITGIRPA
jgi:chromosome segregation ATPase